MLVCTRGTSMEALWPLATDPKEIHPHCANLFGVPRYTLPEMDPLVLLLTTSVVVGPEAPTSKTWLQSSTPPVEPVVVVAGLERVGSANGVGLGRGVSVAGGGGGGGVLVGTAA